MAFIKRTIVSPEGVPGKVETFHVPLDKGNRVVGAGVNNHCIYNLKKRGRHVVEYSDGSQLVFEVVKADAKP